MLHLLENFLTGLGYVFPAYVANATPVVAVKLLGRAHALDFGLVMPDGRRLLGDGKTLEGLASGVAIGTATGLALSLAFPFLFRELLEVLLLCLGAMAGDILGAFVKRRLGLRKGAPAPVLDQLGFLAFSLLLAHLAYGLPGFMDGQTVAALFLFTFFMHVGTNAVAYWAGLKETWW